MSEQILNEILNNIKEFREETNKRIDNLEKDMNDKFNKVYERIDNLEKDVNARFNEVYERTDNIEKDIKEDRIQVATIAENLEIILKNFTRESEERSNKKYGTTEIIQHSIQARQTDLEQRVIKLEKTVYSRRAN